MGFPQIKSSVTLVADFIFIRAVHPWLKTSFLKGFKVI
jgi:hypothetical protein